MIYRGDILRAARAATGLTVRDVREALGLSQTTVAKVEASGELIVGETQRQRGTVEPQTVEALVQLYQQHGITFLPASGAQGPGIRLTLPPVRPQPPAHKAARSGKRRR
jgi:DNA-binding transcriptional MerR regulator